MMIMPTRRIVYAGVASGMLAVLAVGLWLLLAQGEPAMELSAAQALQQACDTMAESDYDKTSVGTTDVDQFTATSSISGNNGHVTLSIYEPDGTTLILQVETILENGVLYRRESVALNHDTFGDWSIWRTGASSDLTLPCFGADTSAAGGSATIQGSSGSPERRIVWKTEETYDGITTQHVLWVDSTGRLVRGEIVEIPYDAAAGSSSGGKVVLEETYSGFGEPNIITAPIATPTPAPTLEPWPTRTPTPSI